MFKKRGFFIIFLLAVLLIGLTYAQEENISAINDVSEDNQVSFIDENAELHETEGITPDSALYFLDEFFDGFGDDSSIREEKIAEIRAMIQQGKIEEARVALERYREHAENLEEEVGPEESEEARRSAAAIYNTLREIESEIPEDEREEFVNGVIDREEAIVTSAEIANKIRDLCRTLSNLDPLEYSRVCRTGDDSPKWQRELDKELTEGQRQEAILFGSIMSECFRTSGRQCRCEEIPFTEFAEMCSIAAPLAVQCNIEGNEVACEELDNLEMPELPAHLQDVFDDLERDMSEAQFDLHMPRECREAGATNPRECMKIMVQTHAPEECRDAILEADVQNEREAREICERIMFELNAPEECIERGLTNPRECGKLMFQLNAQQECLDAGLTGENRGDEKKCREIMGGQDREGFRRPEGGFGGANCRGIQDQMERLRCYDGASQGAQEHREDFESRFRETQEAQRQCAERCLSQGTAWDFSNGQCQCRASERFDDSQFREQFPEPQPGQEFTESQPPQEFTEPSTASGEGTTSTESTPSTTETTPPESGEGIITGGVIFGDNKFLRYFYR